jgi:hypothetical protein
MLIATLAVATVNAPVDVPEPSTWLLLTTGLLSLAFVVWKHRASRAS